MFSREKILKVPVSSRLLPQVKQELEEEAYENGLTVSNYIESILQARHTIPNDKHPLPSHREMKSIIARQRQQLQTLKAELDQLMSKLKSKKKAGKTKDRTIQDTQNQMSKIKSRSLLFSNEQITQLFELIQTLEEKYTEASYQEIVIASLMTAIKNEKSLFFIHTLKPLLS